LQVLPVGDPGIANALVTGAVGPVIASLQETGAAVVVSGPPAGLSADAVLLASHVDGTVLVVQAGVTAREAGQRAKRALTQARARVLGVVLVGGAPG
jgi:Mrp family chromosome partitioning ATPase